MRIDDHIGKVATAFHQRLYRPDSFCRRWQMIYCPSQSILNGDTADVSGGVAVIPTDDSIPEGWKPVQGIFDVGNGLLPEALTRDQLYRRLLEAARRLPILIAI